MIQRGSACGLQQCFMPATRAGSQSGAGIASHGGAFWHPVLRQSNCSPFLRRHWQSVYRILPRNSRLLAHCNGIVLQHLPMTTGCSTINIRSLGIALKVPGN